MTHYDITMHNDVTSDVHYDSIYMYVLFVCTLLFLRGQLIHNTQSFGQILVIVQPDWNEYSKPGLQHSAGVRSLNATYHGLSRLDYIIFVTKMQTNKQ